MLRIGVLCQVRRPKTPMLSPHAGGGEQALSVSRRGFAPELCKTCYVKRETGVEENARGGASFFLCSLRPFRQSVSPYLVTTGLAPVVHAEMQLRNQLETSSKPSRPVDCRIKSGNDEGKKRTPSK